ncbi:hypothetical protein VMCG_08609 [Cytospora schulzeri]|uniref:Uncharacterized protein n=1 Tax=Cytospora schulzeri TaxID=448051 RepID=A0A423VTJ3_9PEZI|nr:hypothetical protein VMCG_08609 [Valsa malicola]
MLPSTRFSQPLAIALLTCFSLLCLVSLGESLKVLSSSSLSERGRHVNPIIKRTWDSEQGPFSPPRPEDVREDEDDFVDSNLPGNVTLHDDDNHDKIGIPVLPDVPLPAVDSIVASIFGGVSSAVPVPGNPTQPIIPASAGGGLFGSVISILAGAPSAVPIPGGPVPVPTVSSGGVDSPLGGVLSALSAVGVPSITAPPVAPTGSGGLIGGLDVLGGVASALDGVLGSPDSTNSNGGGLLGQLSADVLGPIASIAADPASILADPAAAISNLQSQVSSVLDNLPSAVAAGVQIANNVGGQIADALNATTDVLDSIPAVAGGVADQLGSLLNAAPNLATGIPAAALSAVNQVESILTAVPGLDGDVTGLLGGLQGQLSLAVVSALPEVTSLAGVVGSQVVGILPSTLQPLVAEALSTLQNDATSLGCQVSDVVSGTAIILNVPCDQASSAISSPGSGPTVTAPVPVSASVTVGDTLPLVSIQPPSTSPQLASMLSSLGSSLLSASLASASAEASGTNPVAISALSGLSSLISQISDMSVTAAAIMPSTQLAPPTPPATTSASASPGASSNPVAATTIYYVQTITALMTSTAVQTSTVTECPLELSSFSSYTGIPGGPLPVPLLPPTGTGTGPCPGQGFTCDDCLEGWFCPPVETPAQPAPCGFGWPCYHCDDGWFCVPSPQVIGAVAIPLTASTSAVVAPTHPVGPGGTVEQIQSPGEQSTLSVISDHYQSGGARMSMVPKETAIHAWPPLAPTANATTGSASLGMSDLESSILAAVASEANGLASNEPASASAIIQSVSSLLNLGMSSIASSLAMAAPIGTVTTSTTGPSELPLGPGPVIPSTTVALTSTTLVADTDPSGIPTITLSGLDAINPNAETDTSGGDNSVRTALVATHGAKAPMAFGPKVGRWAPRRRAH